MSQWLPSAKWAGSKEFDDAYFKLAGTHPAYHGMQAYAALVVAADAINRRQVGPAGGDRRRAPQDAARDAVRAGAFDAKGQNAHPVLITQVQSGKYKVVWPVDAAEAKPVPTPAWADRH